MFKKAAMIGVVAVGLAAMQAGDALAHYHGWQWVGYWRHVASYECGGFFTQVKNLEKNPAIFECTAEVNAFEVMCGNPKKKDVSPGTPSEGIVLHGADLIREEDLTDKVKGRAQKAIPFPDEGSPLFNDEFCSDLNKPNQRHKWTVIDELVLSVTLNLKTYECIDDGTSPCGDREPAYLAIMDCTIPEGFDIHNPPPDGVDTDYDCTLVHEEHLS